MVAFGGLPVLDVFGEVEIFSRVQRSSSPKQHNYVEAKERTGLYKELRRRANGSTVNEKDASFFIPTPNGRGEASSSSQHHTTLTPQAFYQSFEDFFKRGLDEKDPEVLSIENPQNMMEELKRSAAKGPVNGKGETYLISTHGGGRIPVVHLPE